MQCHITIKMLATNTIGYALAGLSAERELIENTQFVEQSI